MAFLFFILAIWVILCFIKDNILKKISTMAIKKTNDENLLKNITTKINNTNKIIKSIYI